MRKRPKRKPRYYLSDEYLRFYFRYLHPSKELIYRGLKDEALKRINLTFNQHVSFTFEKIARQYMLRYLKVEKVGRWWDKSIEIDIVGVKEDTLYVGECKWSNKKVDVRVLNKLRMKTAHLLKDLDAGDFKVVYYLFSKSGFEGLKEIDEVKLVSLEDLVR